MDGLRRYCRDAPPSNVENLPVGLPGQRFSPQALVGRLCRDCTIAKVFDFITHHHFFMLADDKKCALAKGMTLVMQWGKH